MTRTVHHQYQQELNQTKEPLDILKIKRNDLAELERVVHRQVVAAADRRVRMKTKSRNLLSVSSAAED